MIKAKQDLKKIILVMLATIFLVGCSGKSDPSAYLEGILNARYKAEYEQYMEMTGCSYEEAEQLYTDCLNEWMVVIEEAGISDELQEEYQDFFCRVLMNSKYSVQAVTEEAGVYSVQVSVEPMSVFQNIAEELSISVDAYYTEVTEGALEGAALPGNDEIREEVYRLLLEILNNHIKHISYAEPIVITVHLTEDEDHTFSVEPKDLQKLDDILIDMESMGL